MPCSRPLADPPGPPIGSTATTSPVATQRRPQWLVILISRYRPVMCSACLLAFPFSARPTRNQSSSASLTLSSRRQGCVVDRSFFPPRVLRLIVENLATFLIAELQNSNFEEVILRRYSLICF